MKKIKENKAITLIALIITIIVMLILVGVTVSVTLNGGLFSKAKIASSDTQKEVDYEVLLSAVVGAMKNDATIDFSKLDNNLPEGFTGNNGVYLSKSGNSFIVYEDGTIISEVEKIVTSADTEYEYWKTDGEGTILYYNIPDGVNAPKTLVVPCKIIHEDGTEEVITKIGKAALCVYEVERNEDGSDTPSDYEDDFIDTLDDLAAINPPLPGKIVNIEEVIISKGITEIGIGAFFGLENCTNIILPTTLRIIGREAFCMCRSLTHIKIHEGVTVLGKEAFSDCDSLIKVELPNTLLTIMPCAFRCTPLENINIPNSLLTIGERAFADCKSIKSISIPETVDNMGYAVFDGWTKEQTINMGKTEEPTLAEDYSEIGWARNWYIGCSAKINWKK